MTPESGKGLADRLVGRSVLREKRDTEVFIEEPGRARRVFLKGVARLVLSWGALVVMIWAPPGLVSTLAGGVVGAFVGPVALSGMKRAGAYRDGWLRGRTDMVAAMVEAERRGLTPAEWLAAEHEKTVSVLRTYG